MSSVANLVAFALRQVLDDSVGKVVECVEQHFIDHSQTLPRALARANDRAWQALGVALAGDGFVDQVQRFFASGDDKGIREQVSRFLAGNPLCSEEEPTFRRTCLGELKQLRKRKQLSVEPLDPQAIARQAAAFQRHAEPTGMVQEAVRAMTQVSDSIREWAPNLAKLLRQPTPAGPPLLAAAFCYFFRREVETDDALAHGLFFDGLRQLSASQAKAFGAVRQALDGLGTNFDALFDCLDEIKQDLEELKRDVRALLARNELRPDELRPRDSCSIHSEDERRAVRALLARFRALTPDQQQRLPEALSGLGKLQVAAGDYDEARQTFTVAAGALPVAEAQAEAFYNAYRAALEGKKFDEALQAITAAAARAPQRFAPFPFSRYQPQSILGAGGFGTAFLCRDRNFASTVVVKALHASDLDRSLKEVFCEARLLRRLNHPAIIAVHECEYADPSHQARPYLVMDYFPGQSLAAYLKERGALSAADLHQVASRIAQAMQAAHVQGILHRDLKPDNVLVRQEGDQWQVKIIDFGLALGRKAIETSQAASASVPTILGASVAGTLRYAPPEQLGDLAVPPGPYSDVFAFGKLCCQALFLTTEPKRRHWDAVPKALADLLEKCMEHAPRDRPENFEPVLAVLANLNLPAITALPAATTAGDLVGQVEDLLKVASEAHADARVLTEQHHDHAAAATLLLRVPEHLRDKELFDAVCQRRDRVAQLDREIRQAVSVAHLDGLRTRVAALLALQPDRDDLRRLLATLPSGPAPGDIHTNALGMRFAWIPAGTFLQGSPPQEEGHQENEFQHRVTLSRGFYLGVTPVTQAEWQAIQGNNPSHFKGDSRPVEQASWSDCQEFCRRLSQTDGKIYRLPTEAQWEYACRSGTTTPYHFGDALSTDQANYDGSQNFGRGRKGPSRQQTTPVASFPPNAWGLYDMHGNVWEWCQDWYGDYPRSDATDPVGVEQGQCRVLRGGAWFCNSEFCRAAYRRRDAPDYRYYCGVRVCLDVD